MIRPSASEQERKALYGYIDERMIGQDGSVTIHYSKGVPQNWTFEITEGYRELKDAVKT